jgi:ATP-dependent 26S proteasome regulatory subunit
MLSDSLASLQLSESETPCLDDASQSSLDVSSRKNTEACSPRRVLAPQLEFVYKLTSQSEIIIERVVTSSQQSGDKKAVETTRYRCIGGLKKQIHELRQLIELPLRVPQLFSSASLSPPRGVLLYGLPGTGKTLLAETVMFESKAYIVSISGTDLTCKYYEESETKLRDFFKQACDSAPSVIFIDDLDAVCPRQDGVSSAFEKRLFGRLVSLLDELPKV